MTSGSVTPVVAGVRRQLHEHDLAVVRSVDELLAVAVPYLLEGRLSGDRIQVYVPPDVAARLAELVPDLEVVDPDGFRAMRKPDAIIMRRRMMEDAAVRLRVLFLVREPSTRAWQERERSEAVHNVVYADTAASTLCVYEPLDVPGEALAAARHSHPYLRSPAGRVPNPDYREPREHLAGLPFPDEPLQRTPPALVLEDAASLPALRGALREALQDASDEDAAQDFHLACSEIAANAFRHGVRPVSARLWTSPDRLVCSITDCGPSSLDLLAGYEPAHGSDLSRGGMGLWLARKLCDHVDLLHDGRGLTVRLSTALTPG